MEKGHGNHQSQSSKLARNNNTCSIDPKSPLPQNRNHIRQQRSSPKDATLRPHHLHSRIMQTGLGSRTRILDKQTIKAPIIRLAHGSMHADIRRHARDDQVLHPLERQQQPEVCVGEGATARFVDYRFGGVGEKFGDRGVPFFAADEEAA